MNSILRSKDLTAFDQTEVKNMRDVEEVEYLQAQISCLINRLKEIRKLADPNNKNVPHRLKRIEN